MIGGGALGTVFDIAVLAESGKYRMRGSWRPKRSLALFERTDGLATLEGTDLGFDE